MRQLVRQYRLSLFDGQPIDGAQGEEDDGLQPAHR